MDSVTSGTARAFRARALFVFAVLAFTSGNQPANQAVAAEKTPAASRVLEAEDTEMLAAAAEEGPEDDRPLEAGRSPLVAALWEPKHPADGPRWTDHTYALFTTYGQALLNGVKDVRNFCPNYSALSGPQKYSFWTYLVSAITKYESGYDPTNRYRESSMGIDPVTKQRVFSEGLLQLSYQDMRHYSFCNEFNWEEDRRLAARDPRKSILDPYKNLNCGVRILIQQASRKHLIGFGAGNYWSTLKTSSKHSRVKEIQKLTKKIPFCRK